MSSDPARAEFDAMPLEMLEEASGELHRRLGNALRRLGEALALPESAGRKLEFICQEMGRETNTIGSKANNADISLQVVEIKTALERIREQIQNVQ